MVLFVFRLVFAPDRQGYALTLAELWEQCRRLGVALPQPQPVSASSICAARAKIHADVFRRIHRAILEQAPRETAGQLWHGHRIFAVDGSKLNLPRPLAQEGYRTPSSNAHYPQGPAPLPLPAALLQAVFRLQRNASALFRDFILGDRTDHTAAGASRSRTRFPSSC